MNTAEYICTVDIGGFFRDSDTLPDECVSTLFGLLVKLTEGTVEFYRGDLYHDAMFLHRIRDDIRVGQHLAYGVRTHGTQLYANAEDDFGGMSAVELAEQYNDKVYTIRIDRSDLGKWSATVYQVK